MRKERRIEDLKWLINKHQRSIEKAKKEFLHELRIRLPRGEMLSWWFEYQFVPLFPQLLENGAIGFPASWVHWSRRTEAGKLLHLPHNNPKYSVELMREVGEGWKQFLYFFVGRFPADRKGDKQKDCPGEDRFVTISTKPLKRRRPKSPRKR